MERVAVYVCLLASACCLSSLSAMEGIEVDRDFEINNNLIGNEFQVDNGLSGVGADITNEVMGLLPERDVQNVIGISQEHMDYRNNEESFKFVTHNVNYIRRLIDAVEETGDFPPEEMELSESRYHEFGMFYRVERRLHGSFLLPRCSLNFEENCNKYERLFSKIFECAELVLPKNEKKEISTEELNQIRDELYASTLYLAAIKNKCLAEQVCYDWPHRYHFKKHYLSLVLTDGSVYEHVPENERVLTDEEKEWLANCDVPPEDFPKYISKSFEVQRIITEAEKAWLINYMSSHYSSELKTFKELMQHEGWWGDRHYYAYRLIGDTLSDLKKWIDVEPSRLRESIDAVEKICELNSLKENCGKYEKLLREIFRCTGHIVPQVLHEDQAKAIRLYEIRNESLRASTIYLAALNEKEVTEKDKEWFADYVSSHYSLFDGKTFEELMMRENSRYAYFLVSNAISDLKKWLGKK
ncbi:hypothetical protein FACS1894122_03180 [Alphaproteobacteria bacterium]|nr:hypothetical protein FACS1894122_03180 [Alphaproteobacteria bacterium]